MKSNIVVLDCGGGRVRLLIKEMIHTFSRTLAGLFVFLSHHNIGQENRIYLRSLLAVCRLGGLWNLLPIPKNKATP
jgi:hypothetical protein